MAMGSHATDDERSHRRRMLAEEPWVYAPVDLRAARRVLAMAEELEGPADPVDLPDRIVIGGIPHDLDWFPNTRGLEAHVRGDVSSNGLRLTVSATWRLQEDGTFPTETFQVTGLDERSKALAGKAHRALFPVYIKAMSSLAQTVVPAVVHRLADETLACIEAELAKWGEQDFDEPLPERPAPLPRRIVAAGQTLDVLLVSDRSIDVPPQHALVKVEGQPIWFGVQGRVTAGPAGPFTAPQMKISPNRKEIPWSHPLAGACVTAAKALQEEIVAAMRAYAAAHPADMALAADRKEGRLGRHHQAKLAATGQRNIEMRQIAKRLRAQLQRVALAA